MNTNTITRINALAAAIGLALSANVFSAGSATQGVEYTIPEVREISTTATAKTKTLTTPAAGSDFDAKQELLGYNLSITSVVAANETNKITAQIDTPITDNGVRLYITVEDGGEVELTTGGDETVLTDIGNFVGTKGVTYSLTATHATGAFKVSRNVTFTILDAS